MKNAFLLVLFVAFGTALGAQTEKTLVKAFNLDGHQSIVLDLDGEVDVQRWNNDIVRVQMHIQVDNFSAAILKSLIAAGRYNLDGTSGDHFVISAENRKKSVVIRGNPLQDRVTYTVYVPENVSVDVSAATVQVGAADSNFKKK